MDWILSWVEAHPTLAAHQTIVAGMIAFVGVVFALLGNALLQWLDRLARRRHDRRVVKSALIAELARISHTG